MCVRGPLGDISVIDPFLVSGPRRPTPSASCCFCAQWNRSGGLHPSQSNRLIQSARTPYHTPTHTRTGLFDQTTTTLMMGRRGLNKQSSQ